MSIRIEIICDNVEDLANTLAGLANKFSSTVSEIPVDTAQQSTQSVTASPAEADDDSTPVDPPANKRGRGRPPKAKSETVAPPPGETVEDTAPAGEAADAHSTTVTEQDVSDVIAALTEKFKNGDTALREKIRAWRDSRGNQRMADLKAEDVPSAIEFLNSLKV